MTTGPSTTSDHDENKQIQASERAVVESMYSGQVNFAVHNVWNVWQPNDVSIYCEPLQSCLLNDEKNAKSNLSVVLRVKCSEEYPKRKPIVELHEPRGISNDDAQNLLNILRQRVEELKEDVVIMDLANRVSEFLADHNPHTTTGSFHDDMLANKARTEAEKKRISERRRQDTEQKELELLEEEMRQRNAIELEKTLDGTRPEGETRIIGGRRIVVLSNIPVKRQKPSNACHEWMGFWESTQLLISEWTFRYTTGRSSSENKKRDFEPFIQKFDRVYNDIKKLCEIKGLDQNLVEYAFVHQQKISTTPDSILMQLYVAQKIYPSEESLLDTYELVVPKPNLLRLLAVQAICGLRYLHEASMTHKRLTLTCVWTRNSTGDCVFRFSDFGSLGPLLDLSKLFSTICSGKQEIEPITELEKEYERRKKDLFDLGTLLDTLVLSLQQCGSNYSRRGPTPTQISQTQAGTNLLMSFIKKCQEVKNIDQLVEDPFLKEECQSQSENIFTPFGGAMNPEGRMLSDNVIIRVIGKGGFGDVVLVRNKMDSTDYAIKRIPLNAGSEKMNRKIAKEAKILAKFSHPNMVRYYNSWFEELIPIVEESFDESSFMGAVPIPGKEKVVKRSRLKSVKLSESCEKDLLGGGDSLIPPNLRTMSKEIVKAEAKEWSATPKCSRTKSDKQRTPNGGLVHLSEGSSELNDADISDIDWDAESEEDEEEEESSDDLDEEEEEESCDLETKQSEDDSVFGRNTTVDDEDSQIVFEGASEKKKEVSEKSPAMKELTVDIPPPRNPRILCIQMEYCDRQALRQYIDDTKTLYTDPTEVWRIFSEVLCGLNYMHDFKMIHRDIKPMNIFLTSNGGVKIGDFGLATFELMNSIVKASAPGAEKSNSQEATFSPPGAKGHDIQQTRDIGTQLYMAPELFVDAKAKSDQKTTPYTSKIDIYSAGVVLFEMFYRPLAPGMERVSTLNNLRDHIKIPADFGKSLAPAMASLARKTVEAMLQREPDLRPTAEDLLNDEDLPMHTKEDATFRSLAEKVVKKRDCRMNQWLVEKQFNGDVSPLASYVYDNDICQDRFRNSNREMLVETLRSEFCAVLKTHAFEKVHTHTLMPVSTALAAASVRTKPAEFLDRSGLPVALPMDLRQNFVRYCVRNSVHRMKRFNFGRVYSANTKNVHPHEKWECCVDSIGPQSSSTSLEAELLLVACELISKSLPGMKLTLKIGHAQLLEAQIRHLKLSDDVRLELLDVLHCISVADRQLSHKEKMESLSPKIGEQAANIITKMLIPVENNFIAFREKVTNFRNKLKADEARSLADKAINDLQEVIATFKLCRSTELENIDIVYDSQTCYRPRTFGDGLIFQLQVEKPTNSVGKKKKQQTILAGGRYDSALLRERHPRDIVFEVPLCICGFGVAMDTLAMMREISNKNMDSPVHCKVLICSLVQSNGSNLITEKFKIAKKLWSLNIEADVFHMAVDDLESLNEHRSRASISHILAVCNEEMEIIIKTETGISDVMDMDTAINLTNNHSFRLSTPMTPIGTQMPSMGTPGEAGHHDEYPHTPVAKHYRSSSSTHNTHNNRVPHLCATTANINVIFSEKSHKLKDKKRFENQVKSHLHDYSVRFAPKTKIEVLVCDIPVDLIKKIVGDITKSSTETEIDSLFDQLIQKHGKVDLAPLRRQLHNILHLHQSVGFGEIAVVLYRLQDNFYRCLT
ncbi:hypothetical protein L5515_014414 [Caenorhabditis briggsae]|uniref:non-specific serine/threonine protein kinase n=1 Tax=Caenorhabditis briggsae TaxID=6238 RepID=A0AAE9EDA4_CAEBR|nr:hypothetical protein L5515_014414 [Caenorhabditis briggsae]